MHILELLLELLPSMRTKASEPLFSAFPNPPYTVIVLSNHVDSCGCVNVDDFEPCLEYYYSKTTVILTFTREFLCIIRSLIFSKNALLIHVRSVAIADEK